MNRRPPVWITLLIIVVSLPLFSFPWLLGAIKPGPMAETVKTFVMIYPFYMLLSSWLAWKAWPGRHEVTWILLAVMVLTTVAIFLLVQNAEML
ncbi:MAG: hypothetical protein NC339_02670 [Muribaculaceae bacterium]|nr:hypothetical protein [Muribaculaceae bacterium]